MVLDLNPAPLDFGKIPFSFLKGFGATAAALVQIINKSDYKERFS